ncbi:MAG: hypothetical protein AB3N13_13690, partial [Arenibacterium sp.]
MPAQVEFHNRLKRLIKKHRAMAYGYTMRMRPDGLIVAQPRRQLSPVTGRSFIIFLVAFFAFKSVVMAGLGGGEYGARVGPLSQSNILQVFWRGAMYTDTFLNVVAFAIE